MLLRSGYAGKNNQDTRQDYAQLEQGTLYSPPGAVHRVGLPENASYASTTQLKQYRGNQGHRY